MLVVVVDISLVSLVKVVLVVLAGSSSGLEEDDGRCDDTTAIFKNGMVINVVVLCSLSYLTCML